MQNLVSVRKSCERDEMVMEPQIHFIEKEAYSSVLKAFIAQSDLLSWGKEGFITDLRKELNVTDREHGELLVKINSDGTIKLIREWRKRAIHAQKLLSTEANSHCFPPNSVGNSSQKKVKNSHALILDSQKHLPHGQPASTFLPSPVTAILRDDQCSSKLVMLPGNPRPSVQEVGYKSHLLSKRKGRGPGKPKSEKGFHETNSCNTKKKSDFIKIRDTEKLLYQVEWSFCSRKKPDPIQVEKAKLALREQERSILEALDELADISDDDCSLNQPQHHCSQEKLPGNGRE